jgi:mitosis inhibitor protein kinase SWE1
MKKNSSNNRLRNAAALPGTAHLGHASPTSSSDAGSPQTRRRTSGNATPSRPQTSQIPQVFPPRAPLSRIESGSSATLFFGSPIPPAQTLAPTARSRTNTNLSTPAPVLRRQNTRGNLTNRHSYAGPESSANALHVWNTFQTRNVSPSPRSSPCHAGDDSRHRDTDMEADEDMFFAPDSSFVLNVTSETPSPQSKKALPMKYKHQNSVLVSDEDDILSTGSSTVGDFLQAMPKASISVTSICSDDGLMTPGAAPEGYSGWPTAAIYVDAGDNQHPYGLASEAGVDVDAFIIRTLAAASKGPHLLPKRIPGTPVKKVRMSYFGNERPWQSAVASKVGLRDDCDFNKKKKMPRKSLPAAFPPMGAKPSCDQTTDSEDEQESPITRREKYANLGLGQPSGKNAISGIPRSRWLMRRSSSGAFSSGSDSASLANTPTRSKGTGKKKAIFSRCCNLT